MRADPWLAERLTRGMLCGVMTSRLMPPLRGPMRSARSTSRRVARAAVLLVMAELILSEPGLAQRGVKAPPPLPDTSAITKAMIDRGRVIYRGKGACIVCHGERMEGTAIAPPHRKSTGWRAAKDGAFPELVRVITEGVLRTVMVPLPNGISRKDAIDAAAFIWAVNHRDASP